MVVALDSLAAMGQLTIEQRSLVLATAYNTAYKVTYQASFDPQLAHSAAIEAMRLSLAIEPPTTGDE